MRFLIICQLVLGHLAIFLCLIVTYVIYIISMTISPNDIQVCHILVLVQNKMSNAREG